MASKKTKKATRAQGSAKAQTKSPAKKGQAQKPKKGQAQKPKKAAAKAGPKKAAKGPKKGPAPAKKALAPIKKGAAPKTAVAPKAKPKNAGAQAGKPKFSKPQAPKDTIRRPEDSEELKQKLSALAQATNQIRNLKRTLNRSFYEIGQILETIEMKKLYEVKGYGSFEAFVEREVDIGKQLSLRIVRIVQTFLQEAALKAGIERLSAALDTLEAEEEPPAPPPTSPTSTGTRSPIPLHKQ